METIERFEGGTGGGERQDGSWYFSDHERIYRTNSAEDLVGLHYAGRLAASDLVSESENGPWEVFANWLQTTRPGTPLSHIHQRGTLNDSKTRPANWESLQPVPLFYLHGRLKPYALPERKPVGLLLTIFVVTLLVGTGLHYVRQPFYRAMEATSASIDQIEGQKRELEWRVQGPEQVFFAIAMLFGDTDELKRVESQYRNLDKTKVEQAQRYDNLLLGLGVVILLSALNALVGVVCLGMAFWRLKWLPWQKEDF